MHEVSLAQAIARTVRDAVGDATVEVVDVEVGTLRGVRPGSLEVAWSVVAPGTTLQGSTLAVREVAGGEVRVRAVHLHDDEASGG